MQVAARHETQFSPSLAVGDGTCLRRPRDEGVRVEHRERLRAEERLGPGTAHVQRTLKHLVRDVRGEIKDELAELAAAGNLDPRYAEAVKSLVQDFRDQVQDSYQAAGRPRDFAPAALQEGLGQAMADLTAGLAALREERDGAEAPAETPAQEPAAQAPEPTAPAQPVEPAAVQERTMVTLTAQVSVAYGLLIDLQA